jgi:hypothetical protein
MVINEDSKLTVIRVFSKRKTIVSILIYAALVCFTLAINSIRYSNPTLTGLPSSVELGLGLGFGIGLLTVVFLLWRCPACNKFIGLKATQKVCPHCKAGLEPDWTKTEKPVMEMFKKRKRLVYILATLMFVFFIPIYIASNNTQSKIALIFAVIAGVIDFGIFISIFIIWRCPNCNKYLGKYVSSNCPKCGVRLKM